MLLSGKVVKTKQKISRIIMDICKMIVVRA